MRVPISEEHPVIIDARECEQAGKVYTLRGDVQIQFADYIFHGDLVTYDSAIWRRYSQRPCFFRWGPA